MAKSHRASNPFPPMPPFWLQPSWRRWPLEPRRGHGHLLIFRSHRPHWIRRA